MPVTRLPIVGVLGSGQERHEERATALGRWLATQEVHLITGGGQGVMAAVSQAFAEVSPRRGLVLGVLPSLGAEMPMAPKHGYPNDWVEVPIRTHLPLSGERGQELPSRNHLIVLTACVLIALPGSAGTGSEVQLALRYDRPLIAFLEASEQIAGLPPQVRVEPELEKVQAFVAAEIARVR